MSYKANTTRQTAKTLFPTEKWQRYCKGVYIAKSRTPLEKELQMALILAKHAHTVYMLPEPKNVAGKSPDAIMDGKTIEFKDITGNRNTLGDKYRKALRQADNVFIRAKGIEQRDIYKKLIGTTKVIIQGKSSINIKGYIYVYQTEEQKLYCWSMKDIAQKARKLL